MHIFLYWYQHLPFKIDPIAFSIGSFNVGWYALMYLVGFLIVGFLLYYRVYAKDDIALHLILNTRYQILNTVTDFLLYAFIGLLIGARLGYVLFYNFGYYLNNPLAIISPFNQTGEFIGLYGMSYHGGVIGVFIASIFFLRKYKINFFDWSDFIIPAVPAGYFFGRVGNFLNGELYGRITNSQWGMYFFTDPYNLRYPSQLVEAFLEGIALFIILWFFRNKSFLRGKFLGLYFIGYSLARFAAEFFREPDAQIGFIFNFLTLGQFFSLAMFGVGIIFLSNIFKKSYNIRGIDQW